MFVHQYDLTFNAHCRTFYQVFLYTQSQQPAPKKVFKSCGQLTKSCQTLQNSDFQSQFPMSKIIRIFLKIFFIAEFDFRGTHFVIDIFWKL